MNCQTKRGLLSKVICGARAWASLRCVLLFPFLTLVFICFSSIEGSARNITITADTNWSTISPLPTATDVMLVKNAATVTVDVSNGATAIIGGNNGPDGFATYTLGPASTLIYNGTGPQYVSTDGISFGKLIFTNAGTKTLVTPLAVAGNLTIDSGATLDGSSYAVTLNGNWINNGSFTPSTSTVLVTGTAKNISGPTTFNQVTVSGAYTVTSDVTFNDSLTITTTGSASAGSGRTLTFNGDMTHISGHIQNASSVGTIGVTVTLTGGSSGSMTTDASGNYLFANLLPGLNYTLTPTKTNYAFNPIDLTYNNLAADQTAANFTSTDFSGHAPSLGAATSFAVLAATTVTNTGLTVVSGNIGVSPGTAVTGFGPGVIQNGAIYSGAGSLAGPAQASALTAYNDLVGQGCLPANNLSGKILGVSPGAVTLGPGVYCFGTSAQLTSILTLDDGGDPNALFIFQLGTTLTTASNSQVIMSSGGSGANVYWQIGTSATIGTGTSFRGNLLANTSITMTTGASTMGRLFAIGAAVTMDTNNVTTVMVGSSPQVSLLQSVMPTGTVAPGTDLVFSFVFTNNGSVSASSYTIIDPIPVQTDFKVSSATTGLGTTGLTVTVEYSDDDAATWTYTPVSAGGGAAVDYDRSVTHVRWRFTGTLSQISPNNTGSVGFTARVQ